MTENSDKPNMIDHESIMKTIDLILLGKQMSIYRSGPIDYYFRVDNREVTSESGITTNLRALYCDAFYRTKYIDDDLHDMEDFLKLLNSILEKIDIVFYKEVVKNWKYDPTLRKFIKDNYRGFPISWPTVYSMRQKGVFFSRQRPLNSLLAGYVSLPLNQIRISKNAKRERLRLGLTQVKLAAKSVLAEKTIRNIENPYKSNYLNTLEKLAKGLQIDISRLLG